MHLLPVTLALLLILPWTGASQEASSSDLDLILRRNEEALGGRLALSGVRSVWRQRNARTFTLRQKPDKLLVLLLNDSGGIRYAEGFDGTEAWEILDDGPKRAVSERARVALWHTTQLPGALQPLSRVKGAGHELTLVGAQRIEGVDYYAILLRLTDGFERAYFVHPQTYQIERARDVRRHHAFQDEVQPIETTWSDFRAVGSLVLPFTTSERNYATGERLSGGTMTQIRLNVMMPDDVFSATGALTPFLEFVQREAR